MMKNEIGRGVKERERREVQYKKSKKKTKDEKERM
jgi:hypothetical protein